MKKLTSVLLAVCLLLSLAACGKATPDNASSLADKGASSVAPPADKGASSVAPPADNGASITDDGREVGGYSEGKIGDRMVNEFFAYTVLSAEKATEYAGYTPAAGNTLIVAEIKVENVFGETVPMFSSDFQIQWGPGDEDYGYPVDKFTDGLMEDEYDLDDKDTVTAKVVYELPAIAEKNEYSISYLEIYEDDLEGNVYFVYFEL